MKGGECVLGEGGAREEIWNENDIWVFAVRMIGKPLPCLISMHKKVCARACTRSHTTTPPARFPEGATVIESYGRILIHSEPSFHTHTRRHTQRLHPDGPACVCVRQMVLLTTDGTIPSARALTNTS